MSETTKVRVFITSWLVTRPQLDPHGEPYTFYEHRPGFVLAESFEDAIEASRKQIFEVYPAAEWEGHQVCISTIPAAMQELHLDLLADERIFLETAESFEGKTHVFEGGLNLEDLPKQANGVH